MHSTHISSKPHTIRLLYDEDMVITHNQKNYVELAKQGVALLCISPEYYLQ
jgi:hypothetical protein